MYTGASIARAASVARAVTDRSVRRTANAIASSATPRIDSIATHGNGTITNALTLATSVGQNGMRLPIASVMRAYSVTAMAQTIAATPASTAGESHQMRATAPPAS